MASSWTRQPSFGTSGRYELGPEIGAGGMGVIHAAFDRLAERQVAYKRLRIRREQDRARLTALFQREYDTLVRLDHPNIVAAYDYGFDEQGPYYTMELLSGDDLCKRPVPSYRDACAILRDVASALALVHARRMLHRDVSPNNVRLTQTGRAKLIDFGALTPFGTPAEIVGTPAFIAPECLRDEALDQRTDLYGLGVLAYWLLTKKLPLPAFSIQQLELAWSGPLAPPSRYVQELPAELDELVLALLQRERVARPQCAADVIERLTSCAGLAAEERECEVAFSYLKHTPLRGRAEPERALRQNLEAALLGHGDLLLIEAARGLGRTALLDRLTVLAQLAGATVLRAEARVHGGPLGVVRHLVAVGLATYPDLNESGRGRVAPQSAVEAAEHHARLSYSLQQALLAVAARAPLVLLVDDAHLADEASLALLASLVEAVRARPILLVLSALAGDPQSTAQATLQANAQRIALAPLSQEDAVELVRTMFGDARNSRRLGLFLHQESGGNPAQCLELVRLLLARGAVRYTAGTFTLPHDVEPGLARGQAADLLSRRLSGLPAPACQLARLSSLHEGSLSAQQLVRACGLPAREVLASLARLTAHNVVVSASGRHAYASQALRVAVSESLRADEARALHLALAQMLLEQGELSLHDKHAAGLHMIRAGGAEALAGAELIGAATREHIYEAALSANALPAMEAALAIYGEHGHPDEACAHLLVPLSIAGFYCDMRAQRRYLDRALIALSALSGLRLAMRLRRWLGARLALLASLVVVGLRGLFARATRKDGAPPARSLRQNLEALLAVAAAGCAAAASASDPREAARIVSFLEPFAAAPKRSALRVSREFCLATADLAAGKLSSASERYRRVLARVSRPIRSLDDRTREQLRLGCLNGLAQACLDLDPGAALHAADELERASVFFAPHAESIRMGYHALRGELDEVEIHRSRAETLALRGGASWSAVAVLTMRSLHAAVLTGDVVGLLRTIGESRRLAGLSAATRANHELAQAHLACLRGQPQDALPIYARVLESALGQCLQTRGSDCAMYARALSELGEHARAKALCEETLALLADTGRGTVRTQHALAQRLALAEAGLADFARAAEILERRLALEARYDNPLALGSLHRDRAEIALLAGDPLGFAQHFGIMDAHFRATRNPWLIQQCDALYARALRAGLRPIRSTGEYKLREDALRDERALATVVAQPERANGNDPARKLA